MPATGYAEIQRQVLVRKDTIGKIVIYARHKGLDATFDKVNRNFRLWSEWYYGRYATGYLIRQTGVRKIPSE